MVLAEGCCTVESLDELFQAHLQAGRAPFRFMDEVGLDVVLDIGRCFVSVICYNFLTCICL